MGLPLTSAPIAFFLARDHGPAFAAVAAAGIMAGTISQAGFSLAYAHVALRAHWPLALVAGVTAFAHSTLMLPALPLGLAPLAVLAVSALLVCQRLMPAVLSRPATAGSPLPWWDIPARMIVTTGFVLLLTGVAEQLGPRLTGLVTPFPIYAAALVGFTHALEGPPRAVGVLRGLLLGLYCFVGFFCVLAALLERAGLVLAFTAAAAVALAIQGAALVALRHRAVSP